MSRYMHLTSNGILTTVNTDTLFSKRKKYDQNSFSQLNMCCLKLIIISIFINFTAVWTRPSAVHMENERVSWLHRAGHVTCVCGCSSESWHCSNKLSRDCRNNNILVNGISGCVHFPGSGKILLHGRVAGNAKVGVKFQNI